MVASKAGASFGIVSRISLWMSLAIAEELHGALNYITGHAGCQRSCHHCLVRAVAYSLMKADLNACLVKGGFRSKILF